MEMIETSVWNLDSPQTELDRHDMMSSWIQMTMPRKLRAEIAEFLKKIIYSDTGEWVTANCTVKVDDRPRLSSLAVQHSRVVNHVSKKLRYTSVVLFAIYVS